MWLSRLFKRRKESEQNGQQTDPGKREATIDQGIYYLYMIIGLQVLFVFGILAVIMLVGKVVSTPGWVFLATFLLFIGSLAYIYGKAKAKLRKFRDSFNKANFGDKNYEISLMGGMLTMRIEQNPNAPKLLQAPDASPAESIIDAETIEPSADHKRAHLS